jgi:hypothetical protein
MPDLRRHGDSAKPHDAIGSAEDLAAALSDGPSAVALGNHTTAATQPELAAAIVDFLAE